MKKEINKTRIILFIVAVISFIIHLFIYPKLPAQIPIQWSSTGEVNTYGAKYMDLVIAGIPVLIVPLMVIMPKIDPISFDLDIRQMRHSIMPDFRYHYDDYIQYSPAVLMVGLKAFGYNLD